MRRATAWSCILGSLLAAAAAAGELAFVEAGAESGIEPYQMAPGMGGGLGLADFDDDGDVDVFVPTAEGTPDQLYRNVTDPGGPALFEEIAAEVGLASLARSRSAVWLDADGDRRLDLLVAGDCFQADCVAGTSLLRLYRQTAAGAFVEVTAAAGLHADAADHSNLHHRGGLAAGDVDLDGDPDVFTTIWTGGTRLYENLGDGTFADVSEARGTVVPAQQGIGPWQGLIHDFDGDRRPDIFVAVDFSANRLFRQQAGGTFADGAAAAGLDRAWNEMGIALGDVDGDGDFDLYITNISDEFPDGWRHSTLYLDQSAEGELQYAEVSEAAGVDDAGWGWGTTFLDADNDTLLDLAATNGFPTHVDASRLFLNQGTDPVTFVDVAAEVGFDDTEWGSALAAVDIDRDGDLDLMQTTNGGPLRLLLNQLAEPDRHYLVVQPRRLGRYSRALGARVEVEIGATTLIRLITAGTSHMTQEPAEAFFGLGAAAVADRVTVHWPGDGHTVLENVAADQVLTVTHGVFADGFESGDLSAWSSASGD